VALDWTADAVTEFAVTPHDVVDKSINVQLTSRHGWTEAQPTTDEFTKYVTKKLRAHLRYVTDVDGRRPPPWAVGHLVEYVVRTALRQGWDVADIASYSDRLHGMMFAKHSELIEMTQLSGFTFVEDATAGVEETVLSSSDIVFSKRPDSDVVLSEQPDLLLETSNSQ